MVYFTL